MPAVGPPQDYYKNISKKARIFYWCVVAIVFSIIGTLWIVKLSNH
jgi:hypothetical protein